MRRRAIPVALTIAGSDSSGGAGVQADLKTFAARGVFGCSVVTALTAQNTRGVHAVHRVPPAFVRAQLDAVLDDLPVDAVKTGMLLDARTVAVVAHALAEVHVRRIVVDPVMVAKDGVALLRGSGVGALRMRLVPLAAVVTPNLAEAAALVGYPVDDVATMTRAGRDLVRLGARAAIIKGGHLRGDAVDVLVTSRAVTLLRARRAPVRAPHGTGCTFAAALTAELARGTSLASAARTAKRYTLALIRRAERLGRGHPVLRH